MALGTLTPAQRTSRPETRSSGPPVTTLAFDWIYTGLLLLLSAGIYLDGWSHSAFGPDQSVFSDYHLLFYSSLTVIGLWLVGFVARTVLQGRRGLDAVPAGYALSPLGVVVFGVGGVLDLGGHALFGFEVEMEALLSPTHIMLFIGWALIALGPARAALLRLRRAQGEGTMASLLPMLLSWTLFANVLAFAGMVFLPTVSNAWMLAEWRTDVEFFGRQMGVLGVLVESALLVGVSLWLVRNFRLPAGSFTLFFTLFALLTSIIELNLAFVPVFVVAGVLTDILYALTRPAADRPLWSQLFGTLIPIVLWGSFYAYAFATNLYGGVWVTGYIWTGSLVEAGLVGLLVSLLAVPGRHQSA